MSSAHLHLWMLPRLESNLPSSTSHHWWTSHQCHKLSSKFLRWLTWLCRKGAQRVPMFYLIATDIATPLSLWNQSLALGAASSEIRRLIARQRYLKPPAAIDLECTVMYMYHNRVQALHALYLQRYNTIIQYYIVWFIMQFFRQICDFAYSDES